MAEDGIIKEQWRGKSWAIEKGILTGARTFLAHNFDDLAAVYSALWTQEGVRLNSSHPWFSALKCEGPRPQEELGARSWIIGAPYSIPDAGAFPPKDIDPLLRPYEFQWGKQLKMLEVTKDLDNRKICNSAGFLPLKPLTQRVITRTLQVFINEPFYDLAKSAEYENTVNSDAFTLGTMSIDRGQAYITSIEPAGRYPANATFIPMVYEFEIDVNGTEPWQPRLIDRSRSGWCLFKDKYVSGPLGTVVGENFFQAKEEVLLDGLGKPMIIEGSDTQWKVGVWIVDRWKGFDPVAPPASYPCYPLDGDDLDVYIRPFRLTWHAPFSGLGL
jgi:hypothetical protein